MMPSPMTWLTVPSKRWTASIMSVRTGSRSLRASSGVAIGEELHRALEVAEEDRDLLAFALERGLGGQDLLGEVLGEIGLGRRSRASRGGGGGTDGLAAFL